MDNCCNFLSVLLLVVPLCHSQTSVSLTEPTLIAVYPVNSTALNVTWQFVSDTYDQSDLIRIYIEFYEFYYGYTTQYTSVNYTFTKQNDTITSLTQNFQLVNAFYYVCFSTNSTNINATTPLFVQKCQLARTCSRSNSSCSQASFVIILATDISSNAFTVTVYWLNQLTYIQNSTSVGLSDGSMIGTQLSTIYNDTYTSIPFRFSGLQPSTSYIVNTTVSYTLYNNVFSATYNLTVQTSRSSNLNYTGDKFKFVVLMVLLSFLFC
jgi:hypothetical protein